METLVLDASRPFRSQLALAKQHAPSHTRRAALNAVGLGLAEGAALALCLALAGVIRLLWTGEPGLVVGAGWAVIPLYLAGMALWRMLPGWGLGAVEEFRRQTLTLVSAFVLAALGIWLAGTDPEARLVVSRLTLGLAGVLSLVLVPLARSQAKSWLIRREKWGVPAVVYGAGEAGARVVRQLQEESGIGYRPVAIFDDDPERWGGFLDTIPIVGELNELAPEAAVAFLALPEEESDRQSELLEGPLALYPTVVVVPELVDGPTLGVRPRDIGGILAFEVAATLTRPAPRAVKRMVDLAVVVGLALFWMPVIALLSLAIWLEDRANPFYGQVRVGQDGETFTAWKLRTMVPDADAALQRALDADPELRAEWETFFKLEKDPRITRVGNLLRRTSLDELPQLFNVLIGDMSLVGPRPLPRYHHDELVPRVRTLRERVRPGITGLWQVSGRSDSGNAGMERWDPYYVRNWSPWLDAVILVRTVRVVLRGSGAY
ncbi:MAG: exopolysaccharide biosynthesis polyprenyl glycosylphosphotransferase [Bacteroidota bacterium]